MGYWEYDSRDGFCSDFLPRKSDSVVPYLYVSSIDSHNKYVFIETIRFETDAEFIWLLNTDFGSIWPNNVTNRHAVIHTNRWMQEWSDGVTKFPGVDTEIVRSTYADIANLPLVSAPQKLSSIVDLLDFNALLAPGKGLLFVPAENGAVLRFTLKLYKFAIYDSVDLGAAKSKLASLIEMVDKDVVSKANLLLDILAKIDKKLDRDDQGAIRDSIAVINLLCSIVGEVVV